MSVEPSSDSPEMSSLDPFSHLAHSSGDANLNPEIPAPQKRPRQTTPTAGAAVFDFEFSPSSAQSNSTPHVSSTTAALPLSPANPDLKPTLSDTTGNPAPLQRLSEDTPSLSSEVSLAFSPLNITLLCNNGTRVSFTLDQAFIKAHCLPVKDPHSISISQLKKVIYDEWMSNQKQAEGRDGDLSAQSSNSASTKDWGFILASNITPAPVSPNHMRLIHLGKVLTDDYALEEYKITSTNTVNVLHLSIRPESMEAKDRSDVKHGRAKGRGSSNSGAQRLSGTSSHRDGDTADASRDSDTQPRSGCCIIS